MTTSPQPIIEIEQLTMKYGSNVILKDLDLTIMRGEILGVVGGSGSGKTTLLRDILMLDTPSHGSIKIFGIDVVTADIKKLNALRQRWGMMFQQGALFSSLTVLENVSFPLQEFTKLSQSMIEDIAMLKMSMSRFPLDSVQKYPSELSGGMLKRAALARAIVMDPEILFLDEPTAGLDPISAGALDELVLDLQSSLGLTIVIVTHDMDTLWSVTDRVAFLGEKKVIQVDPMETLSKSEHPLVKKYFTGPRARNAQLCQMEEGSHGN